MATKTTQRNDSQTAQAQRRALLGIVFTDGKPDTYAGVTLDIKDGTAFAGSHFFNGEARDVWQDLKAAVNFAAETVGVKNIDYAQTFKNYVNAGGDITQSFASARKV